MPNPPNPPGNVAAETVPARSGSPRSILRRMKLEAAVFVLLLITFMAVQYQELVVSRELKLTPASTLQYPVYAYDDANSGGHSTIDWAMSAPLRWACDLKAGFAYPYCGYGLLFDVGETGDGVDLSGFDRIKIAVNYQGGAERLRLVVKDHDPRYGNKAVALSAKPNELEVPIQRGSSVLEMRMQDFIPAQWWITENNIPVELSGPSFSNITGIEFQPGTGSPLGRHEFRIESITFEGTALSQAQFYLLLLGFWVLLIGGFLVFRVINLRAAFESRHKVQVQESHELKAAKAAAESASHAKSEFLANMSHELRTPLNAILGYAQLLERAQLDEQHALAARTIHRSGSHLLTLITDILDLSKIEAGKLDLNAEPLDLHACVEEVAEMMKVRADEKGLRLSCTLAPDLPRYVEADEKRIRQLLINLAGNAVKFTAQGEVAIRVATVGSGAEAARIRFEVEDTGPGIPAEKLDLVFEPFEQIGAARQRAGGTGLGLSISRQIVTLMGGEIRVESTPGSGSRFWFELELPIAHELEGPAAGEAMARLPIGYTGPRRRILVVDDLEENRAVIADTLRQLGFDPEEAADGQQAVEAASRVQPDLVLMDIRMPVMDGFEATRIIRATPELSGLPIIAVSASVTEDVKQESLAAGANGFLTKPLEPDKLARMLVRHLDLEWIHDESGPAPDAGDDKNAPMVAPPGERMAVLHKLALAGNMRAIRTQAKEIRELGDEYRSFADAIDQLARSYQSPAILRLIEGQIDSRRAA